jgi:broad specificity phosphatase PhoE
MNETVQHLVLGRHGESEGDRRRAAWKRGEAFQASKTPDEEEITSLGVDQCRAGGVWVAENVIKKNHLPGFEGYFASTALRSLQSAIAMDLPGADWQADPRLDERNRGLIRGLHPNDHKRLYPDSYRRMREDPLHWIPPGGNAIIPDLVNEFESFYEDIKDMESIIIEGHRDQIWAAMMRLEDLTEQEMSAVDTESINPGYLIYYTAVHPRTGERLPGLCLKYTVDPMRPEASSGWQVLTKVVRKLGRIASIGS